MRTIENVSFKKRKTIQIISSCVILSRKGDHDPVQASVISSLGGF